MIWPALIERHGGSLRHNFGVSTLAHVSDGYSAGAFDQVLMLSNQWSASPHNNWIRTALLPVPMPIQACETHRSSLQSLQDARPCTHVQGKMHSTDCSSLLQLAVFSISGHGHLKPGGSVLAFVTPRGYTMGAQHLSADRCNACIMKCLCESVVEHAGANGPPPFPEVGGC